MQQSAFTSRKVISCITRYMTMYLAERECFLLVVTCYLPRSYGTQPSGIVAAAVLVPA